ncbi:MAG: SOS response-associated peptidase [Actinomycetota bacterium]
MCGRYVQASSPELLAERFGVDEVRIEGHEPHYNVAPRAEVPAVRRREGRTILSSLRWGLVPSWAKDPKMGDRLINARAESVADKPAYRKAFEKRRCIIPADGFYEWDKRPGQKRKQPMFVHLQSGEPMAFAGLWEIWKDPKAEGDDEGWLRSCAIVTTDANDLLEPIHDRMPVILPESAWETWLDPAADPDVLRGLLVPTPDDLVAVYPVSPLVNSADNDGPELVQPFEPDPQLEVS